MIIQKLINRNKFSLAYLTVILLSLAALIIPEFDLTWTLVVSALLILNILFYQLLSKDLKTLKKAISLSSRMQDPSELEFKFASRFKPMLSELSKLVKKNINLVKLSAEKVRMERELFDARDLQLTNSSLEKSYNRVKIHGLHLSASEVSGDWWFHEKIDDKVIVAVGDATGHGVAPALVTVAVKTAMSLLKNQNLNPSQILSEINKVLYNLTNGRLGMSMSLCIFNESSLELQVSSASHPIPYFLQPDGDIDFINAPQGPILGFGVDDKYEDQVLQLSPGHSIMMYTDGLVELNGKNNEMYGEKKLYRKLKSLHKDANKIENIVQILNQEVQDYAGDLSSLGDDITLLIVEVK
ncbi:MAG: PP2C family protein-serine/threonine phosphatase [Bdellovibrionales bacterium]